VKAYALQPSHADHVSARHQTLVRYMQVYMDSINDLLWEGEGSGVGRPKLEVRIGAFGSHLPGLVEKQVCLTTFLTALLRAIHCLAGILSGLQMSGQPLRASLALLPTWVCLMYCRFCDAAS